MRIGEKKTTDFIANSNSILEKPKMEGGTSEVLRKEDSFEVNSAKKIDAFIRAVVSGQKSRTELLELSKDPANLKGISPREAQLAIEFLAEGPTSPVEEKAIVSILEAMDVRTRGQALRLLQGGADEIDIQHLLCKDIDTPALRTRAAELIEEAKPYMKTDERIILSDIDDTVKPFKDNSVDGPVFPGARALYRALDLGKDGKGNPGDIHFITARDGFFIRAEGTLERTGIETGSISYGDAVSGFLSLFGYNKGVEEKKVKNIKAMLERNPSSKAILIGDSTQADPQVFMRILKEYPERIELAMIHRVSGYEVPPEIANHPKILVFDNYAEAAKVLYEKGVISKSQLEDVLNDR